MKICNIYSAGINELRKVPFYKVRLINLKESIDEIDKSLCSVRISSKKAAGALSDAENRVADIIDKKQELQNELIYYLRKLEKIDRSLGALSKEQKIVLSKIVLKENKHMRELISDLMDELFLSRSKIYKILKEATENFLTAFGPM